MSTCQLADAHSLFVPQIQIAAQNSPLAGILKYEGLLEENDGSAQRDSFLFFLFENECPWPRRLWAAIGRFGTMRCRSLIALCGYRPDVLSGHRPDALSGMRHPADMSLRGLPLFFPLLHIATFAKHIIPMSFRDIVPVLCRDPRGMGR